MRISDWSSDVCSSDLLVALLHVQSDQLAVVAAGARTSGKDLALHGPLFGGVGDDDATGGLFIFLQRLDHDTVMQRPKFHGDYPVFFGFEFGCSPTRLVPQRAGPAGQTDGPASACIRNQ